jgi:hypothetical protein
MEARDAWELFEGRVGVYNGSSSRANNMSTMQDFSEEFPLTK